MTKKEMVVKLAKKTGLTQDKAAEVINAIFDTDPGAGIIAVELDAGGKLQIPGFGTFAVQHRGQRTGRSPATGETITIPAKSVPVFRPGKGLKSRVSK